VVYVAVGETHQDHLPVGIRAMLDSLVQVFAQRRFRRDLANDACSADAFTRVKVACCEEPEAAYGRRLDLNTSYGS
jgi:hypothetical protein